MLPEGMTIRNISGGRGEFEGKVYASLYAPDGRIIMSAELEYITKALLNPDRKWTTPEGVVTDIR